MQHPPKYSIIVPVYNAENTLDLCIKSILGQDFKDFELILINDGSKDNSLQVLREYEKKDTRILVIDKPNGGVSSARNAGLDIAKGDYIVFIDADDYIDYDFLCTFNQYDADVIICGYKVYDRPDLEDTPEAHTLECKEDIIKFICDNIPRQFILTPWSKAFKRTLFEHPQQRYDTKIRFGEDIELNYRLFAKADTLKSISKTGYNYFWGNKNGKWIIEPREYKYTLTKLYAATESFPIIPKEKVREVHKLGFNNYFFDGLWESSFQHSMKLSLKYFRYRLYEYMPYSNLMKLRKTASILAIPYISLFKKLKQR